MGRAPRPAWAGKVCGDCFFWRLMREYPYDEFEGGGRCRNPERVEVNYRSVALRNDSACADFLSPWRRDREILERLGQKCIQFVTRGGG